MNTLTLSKIRWNNVTDRQFDKIHMTRRCTGAGINVLKLLAGKSYELATENIGELDKAVTELIRETMGHKPACSTSTLRRHGLLKYEIKNGKGYAVFTKYAYGVKRANADHKLAIA